jgi:hypothetical protein
VIRWLRGLLNDLEPLPVSTSPAGVAWNPRPPSLEQMVGVLVSPGDFFAYRRELAGIPDAAPHELVDVPPARPMRPELDGEAPAGELERRRLFWEVLIGPYESVRFPAEVLQAIDAGATLEQVAVDRFTRVRVWLEPPSDTARAAASYGAELDRLADDGGRA